uniref:ATP-dependent DNA helicase n=2 Tax=Cacopsylla melanoneura TaxID=428564 RepID=A0A8D8QAR4_9HEMI
MCSIAVGSVHQGNAIFGTNAGSQCTAMAASSIIFRLINSSISTSQDVDRILKEGNEYFALCKERRTVGRAYPFIESDDLVQNVRLFGYNVRLTREWKMTGLFQYDTDELAEIRSIASQLLDIVKPFRDDNVGFIFTLDEYAVSFWRSNNKYYLFNSHSTDNNGKSCTNGYARLLECPTMFDLVRLLLLNKPSRGSLGVRNILHDPNSAYFEVNCIQLESHSRDVGHGNDTGSPRTVEEQVVIPRNPHGPKAVISCSNPPGVSTSPPIQEQVVAIRKPVGRPKKVKRGRKPRVRIEESSEVFIEISTGAEKQSVSVVEAGHTVGNGSQVVQEQVDSGLSVVQSDVVNSKSVGKSEVIVQADVISSQIVEDSEIGAQSDLGISQTVDFIKPIAGKRGRPEKNKKSQSKISKSKRAKIQNQEINNVCENISEQFEGVSLEDSSVDSLDEQFEGVSLGLDDNSVGSLNEITSLTPHQRAVLKYRKANPDLQKGYDRNYNKSEARQASRVEYRKNNPESVQNSNNEYNASEARQVSRVEYRESNPESVGDSNTRYLENNEENRRRSQQECYERSGSDRYLPLVLRRYQKIGMIPKDELGVVPLFQLKSPLLGVHSCSYCNAPLFFEEKTKKMWCCRQGDLIIPELALHPINAPFYHEKEFIKNARYYNNLFAFSALGTSQEGGFEYPRQGPSMVKVCGRIYHRIFDLSYNRTVNNFGFYIDDGEERRRFARGLGVNVDSGILSSIESFINEVNPFVSQLRRLSNETSETAHIVFKETNRRRDGPILGENPLPPEADSSALRHREVCALVNLEAQEYDEVRDVVAWKIGDARPHRVYLFSECYETLQYPLLFPYGDAGWRIGLVCKKGEEVHKVSQLEYYRYRMLAESRFTSMGRLSCEYFLDMFVRTDEERLKWLKETQKKAAQGNVRTAGRNEIDELEEIDREQDVGRIYLPKTFIDGPRYFLERYKDSMAVVQFYGNVSFFLTFTCNSRWVEIQRNLRPHETAFDRPDLVCRVFEQKKQQLVRLLVSGRVFGPLEYIFSTCEFQKRGLPHVHICLRVVGGGPKSSEEIDSYVSATIPREDEDSRLRELVLKHMVHGPCRRDLCIEEDSGGKCSKRFPKVHTDVTHFDDNGFVFYKRDAFNSAQVRRGNRLPFETNDTYIVPYNPVLLKYFDSHLNVEIATSRKSVKYLFKYIHKGPDKSIVSIIGPQRPNEPPIDEIRLYRTYRYISSSEAVWRLLSYDISSRKPTVKCLSVHLPGRDRITFQVGRANEAAEQSLSMLDVYLRRPHTETFEPLTYCQFYQQYDFTSKFPENTQREVFETSGPVKRFIVKRAREGLLKDPVCRVYWVSPNRGELYFLRVLLLRYPCYDLEELKRVNDTEHSTFQQACIALGLVQNEEEYVSCMREAKSFMMAGRLRRFFCLLVNIGAPAEFLWNQFREDLCEDFMLHMDRETAFENGLMMIDRILRNQGSSNIEHGLPPVDDRTTELIRERERWTHQAGQLSHHDEWIPKLNEKQKEVFDVIVDAVVNSSQRSSPKLVYVDGAAGTGKTLVISVLTSYLRSLKHVVLCTATSGIAALNHEGGMTAHSMFKLPLDVSEPMVMWSLSAGTERAELIRSAAVLIFDEVAMAHKNLLHCLDRSLRLLMHCNEPMGGKVFVALGDFRQIGPVIPYGQPSDVVQASFRNSHLWPLMKVISLTAALRTRNDAEYTAFLSRVGDGLVPTTTVNGANLIPLEGIRYVTDVNELIETIYPSSVLSNSDLCAERAILSPTYVNIRQINSLIIDKLQGEEFVVYSADSVRNEQDVEHFVNTEALNSITNPSVPNHVMKFKIGCVCIILRNISFEDKLCNGTKVIILGKSGPLIRVRKPHETEEYLIPRIDFDVDVTGFNSRVIMIRKAYPLLPSYALSINRSQGQTFSDIVGADLRNFVFSHGMLYVLLGRITRRSNIVCLVSPRCVIDNVAYTKNVVYSELRL